MKNTIIPTVLAILTGMTASSLFRGTELWKVYIILFMLVVSSTFFNTKK
jgi:hypothetical protein